MTEYDAKFGRNYLLKVELEPRVKGSKLEDDALNTSIAPPFTCEFNISRSILASANTANFKVYNLSKDSRDKVYMDQYQTLDYRAVQFWGGYGKNTSLCFNGNLRRAWSYREGGSTDVITEFEAYEGVYAMNNGYYSGTLKAGETYADIVADLAGEMPYLDKPIISGVTGEATRGCVLQGNTWQLIKTYSGGTANIDNNRVQVLKPNECLPDTVILINSDSGLLNSPIRTDEVVEFDILFMPELKINAMVRLESLVNSRLNGFYKVVGITHSGMISEAICGVVTTKVQLWRGGEILAQIKANQ